MAKPAPQSAAADNATKSYSDTLNLPRTDFPMRANLPKREPARLAAWQAADLYGRIREARAGAPKYLLHDGPPYANGDIHMGTTLNKLLKDFIVKFETMRGHDAPYVPGYDCHGLPIEFKVLQELGKDAANMSKAEIRARCREYALSFVDSMSDDFQRLGVLGTWDKPYLTLDPVYETAIVSVFAEMYHAGFITQGKKPIQWCAHCRTALAEAEVEYLDHTSPSIFVRFPLVRGFDRAEAGTSIVIWTTTPWTLPANLATTVHPDFTYVIARVDGECVIVAEDLLAAYVSALDTTDYRVETTFPGRELEGAIYRHPFVDRECPVILGTHVTLDQGTGCVHTAPGHGQEDYVVGLAHDLAPYSPVDDDGCFTADVPQWAGMSVFDANGPIVDALRECGALAHHEPYQHQYPHCWRCSSPVIFRATPQWFIGMDHKDLRQQALRAIENVQWVPEWGFERFHSTLSQRPDWCISRQRTWGVPIPVFFCAECDAVVFDEAISEHVIALVREHGVDVWFDRDAQELLPAGTACPACGGTRFTKEEDILDVWFESGVSHRAVLETREELGFPADLYLEGSDQHRGWFQSSLIPAMATRERPPYRAVLTHGYVVTADGRKMSKKLGNAIQPGTVLTKYGADILRLWVASENFRQDVRVGEEILQRNADTYRGLRNTFRGMLGNLADYDPAQHPLDLGACDELDRYMLHRLGEVVETVTAAYAAFEFHTALQTLSKFCNFEVSALYYDVRKDRLYCAGTDAPERRACQAVLHTLTSVLARLLAPILAFTADEVWEALPGTGGASVHLAAWPEADPAWTDASLAARWERLLSVRDAVKKGLEIARAAKSIGGDLEAAVTVAVADDATRAMLEALGPELERVCIVSGATVVAETPSPGQALHRHEADGIVVDVAGAAGAKCARCWRWSEFVGANSAHPALCDRCSAVVTR